MKLVGLLLPLLGLVATVTYFWLVAIAFKKHTGWGIGVLLLSPFSTVVFAIKYWEDAKKPFLIHVGSFAGMIVCLVMTFFALGGGEMIAAGQAMERGEFTQDDAANLIEGQMDRIEATGQLDTQEKQDMEQMRGMLREMRDTPETAENNVAAATATPPTVTYATAPVASSVPVEVYNAGIEDDLGGAGPIPLSRAASVLGAFVRVTYKDGSDYVGHLADAPRGKLLIQRELSGGYVMLEVANSQVRSLEVIE